MTRTTSGAPRRSSAVLAMSGITVDFGPHVALTDVTLEVYAGQVVGVIGPNGAGKTTLLDVACGAVAPTAGRLSWHDKEVARLRPKQAAKLGISRTMQQLELDERSPVLANVMAGAELPARPGSLSGILGVPRSHQQPREVQDRAHAALNDLGIAAYADQCPAGLPTAVRKRVALARALVRQPELLLLDELAGGLSPAERSQLGKAIRQLTRRTSVVLVEHHMDVVMHACDHVLVLDSGRVIAQGRPDEVRADPAVKAAYLDVEPQGDDPYRLVRFVTAQEGVHTQAMNELRAGRKTSHWMWFVFPQLSGLGSSPMAQRFAIGSLAEARAYLSHPILGPRLVESARAVLSHLDRTAREIMGSPDDVKLRSSMTLFALAGESEPVFQEVLDTFFAGEPDPRTVELLGR